MRRVSVARITGLDSRDVVGHDSGDRVAVGAVEIELLHTPGHTPGSQCFLVDGMLVAGDTLFLEGCGRTDLPGSDSEAMYESLQRLASLPDEHRGVPRAPVLRALDRDDGGRQGDQHGVQAVRPGKPGCPSSAVNDRARRPG